MPGVGLCVKEFELVRRRGEKYIWTFIRGVTG
jgi:hypothetical protein